MTKKKRGETETATDDKHDTRDTSPEDGLTLEEIMKTDPIKAYAVAFVNEHSRVLDDEQKKAIASWAFRAGMASLLKKAERAFADFGAGTIFAALCEASDTDCPSSLEGTQPNSKKERPILVDPMYA
jgi:hypothetical protein